jgi:hypothetical protein
MKMGTHTLFAADAQTVFLRRPSHLEKAEKCVRPHFLPAAAVFPHVNEPRKSEAWSPWARLDPNAKSTFEGPAAGTGAIMAWAGNRNVGEGKMTIVESRANELVRFELEFFKPFRATNTAEFTFRPEGHQTNVSWSMSGTNNFVAKAVKLFINCDRMVGAQFEQGLADLRAAVASPGDEV